MDLVGKNQRFKWLTTHWWLERVTRGAASQLSPVQEWERCRTKARVFRFLVKRVERKMMGWNLGYLVKNSKVALVKCVNTTNYIVKLVNQVK